MADEKAFYRRKGCLVGVALALFLVASPFIWYWFTFLRGWSVADVERLVQAEMPLGTTHAEVEAVLDKHGIKHSKQPVVGPRFHDRDGVAGQSIPQAAGLADRDVGWITLAFIEDANVDLVYKGSISAFFLFDHEGRLIGHLVHSGVWPFTHLQFWLIRGM